MNMKTSNFRNKIFIFQAEIALKGLLEVDCKISLADSTLIDNAWHGAEAYHFYMLAHRQLYNGYFSNSSEKT